MDFFTWTDRQGVEHPLVPTNSSCDLKNPAWESNQGEVNDMNPNRNESNLSRYILLFIQKKAKFHLSKCE